MKPGLRQDFYLAKVAGEDIDLTTLTPPTPVSDTEKYLVKIADRLDEIEEGQQDSGGLIVTVRKDGSIYKANKTVDEIYHALESGRGIQCKFYPAATPSECRLLQPLTYDMSGIIFNGSQVFANTMTVTNVMVISNGVSVTEQKYDLVPHSDV